MSDRMTRSQVALAAAATAMAIYLAAPIAVLAQDGMAPAQQSAPAGARAQEPSPPASPAPNAVPNAASPDAGPAVTAESAPPASEATPVGTAAGAPSDEPSASPPPAQASEPAPGTPADPSPPSGPRDVEAEKLPRDLSPWSMFISADIVVKAVMLGLIFASFVTWTVWIAKSIELWAGKARAARALREINEARTLSEIFGLLESHCGVGSALVNAAAAELHASWNGSDPAGIKDRIASRMERLELAAVRDMNKGTGVLATIGSTAPFVGLFGTVWGIMNSFIGISEAQTTNLAIVAPGIAEALLATAFGLVAAIPAVICYNQLARSIGGYRVLVGDAAAAVLRLVSRDFERGAGVELRAAE